MSGLFLWWDWGLEMLLPLMSHLGPEDIPVQFCCLPSQGIKILLIQFDIMSYSARLQPKFMSPHYSNCSAQHCNLKSAASDNKSSEVWNLLSHLLRCSLDAHQITSGIWQLPCLSCLLIHLSQSPPMETREKEHQGEKMVVCWAQGAMLAQNIDADGAQTWTWQLDNSPSSFGNLTESQNQLLFFFFFFLQKLPVCGQLNVEQNHVDFDFEDILFWCFLGIHSFDYSFSTQIFISSSISFAMSRKN